MPKRDLRYRFMCDDLERAKLNREMVKQSQRIKGYIEAEATASRMPRIKAILIRYLWQ